MRKDILVSYDVNTLDAQGRARLRRVAKACKNCGQRVQYSVFECSVSDMVYERLKRKLLSIINPEEDSLRIYHLRGKREEYLEAFGLDRYVDFGDALVV
jgi:CRISPR-associated protein Cas2